MEKMRIGDVIITRPNGTDMIWEWNKTLKVKAGEEFDPLRAVNVYGCNGTLAEVTVAEPKVSKKKRGK